MNLYDVVQLQSEGCKMTVVELPASGLVGCKWITPEGMQRYEYFPAGALKLATGGGGYSEEIPAGLIVMWSGLLSSIPSGWVLCDGQNGTPDLRDKFVRGAAASVDPGTTGGNLTHSHAAHAYTPAGGVDEPVFTGTTVSTSLNSSGTPTGSVSWPTIAPTFAGAPITQVINHTHPVNDPGHTHTQPSQTATTGSQTSYEHGVVDTSSALAAEGALTGSATTGITTGNPAGGVSSITPAGSIAWPAESPPFVGTALPAHQHSVTATGTVSAPAFIGTPATLSHDAANHLPPYYELAFIMKT